MWCRSCGIETNEYKCPVCGKKTEEEIPVEIYWCDSCKTPIIKQISDSYKDKCPCCGRKTKYMAKDIRPVFPEERLLMELLMGKAPNTYADASVWATGSRYYIDGTVKVLSKKDFEKADIEQIAKDVVKYKELLTYDSFELYTERFINANRDRFNYLVDEASMFVKETASRFKEENLIISFSGGKDSTVTADVVTKALADPSLVHIFGNTTLEFPTTIDYAERFRKEHPRAILISGQTVILSRPLAKTV